MIQRVHIKNSQVALVFKNGNYKRILENGSYWLGLGESISVYDRTQVFSPNMPIGLLRKEASLMERLTEVVVPEQEIVLLYEDGLFSKIISKGIHFFWDGIVERTMLRVNWQETTIDPRIDKALYSHIAIRHRIRVFTVESHEKGLLYIDGMLEKTLAPGQYHFWNNDTAIKVLKADIRQKQIELAGQEMLTKDKAALRVNFTAQYRIENIQKALIDTNNVEAQLYAVLQLALREYIGTLSLDELLANKEKANTVLQAMVSKQCKDLGVLLINTGIKDIILPGEVKDIMKQVLVAQKQAQANNILRREETASTRSLLNTAKLMEENSMLFRLKEMEYNEKLIATMADKVGKITLSSKENMVTQLKRTFSS